MTNFRTDNLIIDKRVYRHGKHGVVHMEFRSYLNGISMLFDYNGKQFSIISHPFSYGRENGTFEVWDFVQPNWDLDMRTHDVQGWLTFTQAIGQVEKWINCIDNGGYQYDTPLGPYDFSPSAMGWFLNSEPS